MADIEINLTGGTYQSDSLPISAQVTRNLYPQLADDPITKNKYNLTSWVGMALFGATDSSEEIGRGQYYHRSLLYRVAGTTLYSVTNAGVHTSLGTIGGSDRCIFTPIGASLVIIANRTAYVWNGSTLSTVSDVDLQSPDSATTLNNQVIYDGNNDQFGVSDVGDPTSINALNYATAESRADNLIRCYAFKQILYLFGERTIEEWWNSGVGKPPFDRIEGGIIDDLGLDSLHGVANNEDFIYFCATDKLIYRLVGSSKINITPDVLAKTFSNYTTTNTIIWCMKLKKQNFIVITFPTNNKTYVFIEGGQVFEWSSGVDGGRSIANSYVYAYNKHLVEDYRNGNIYELDFDTYDENGTAIIRQRDSATLDSQLFFGVPNRKVFMNKLVIHLERGSTGVLNGGQGSDPVIMLQYSDDEGRSFSTERWAKIGKQGQFKIGVQFNALGSFYKRVIRLKMSDPVRYTILGATASVKLGL